MAREVGKNKNQDKERVERGGSRENRECVVGEESRRRRGSGVGSMRGMEELGRSRRRKS